MSPRRYSMERRAEAVERTRQAIVEATMRCHARQGILETTIQDVAREADVALGTVYRHFPTLNDLVSACGQASMEALGLPDEQDARRHFTGVRGAARRIEQLVDAVAPLYERAAPSFIAVRAASDELPAAAAGHARMEGAIDLLVEEALRPLRIDERRRRTIRALLDARFWLTLADRGLDAAQARAELAALLLCAVRSQPARRSE